MNLIITTPKDQNNYKKLFGDESNLGLSPEYIAQECPKVAQAFILGSNFIGNDDVCLILGDNIFGHGFVDILNSSSKLIKIIKLQFLDIMLKTQKLWGCRI